MRTNSDGYFMSEKKTKFKIAGLPKAQGLYNPINEHDACGVGLVLDIKNRPSFDIVEKGLAMLCNLEHRGAVSSDGKTGDGAGILIEIPHEFIKNQCEFNLPKSTEYAVGMVFLPQKDNQSSYCIGVLESELKKQGLDVLGWRKVPVKHGVVGKIASQTEPKIMQIFVGKGNKSLSDLQFNNKLFCARKISENIIIVKKKMWEEGWEEGICTGSCCSCSCQRGGAADPSHWTGAGISWIRICGNVCRRGGPESDAVWKHVARSRSSTAYPEYFRGSLLKRPTHLGFTPRE